MNHCFVKTMSMGLVACSLLVACGPGKSTSNDSSEDQSSSSSCAEAQVSSGENPTSLANSSSSVIPTSSVTPASTGISSSSCAAEQQSSSLMPSSSVIPASTGISSSSRGTSSSSTIKPSSTKLSSSVIPISTGTSSSVAPSSSSWNPFKTGVSYGEFTDTRNNKVYKTVFLGFADTEMFAQNLDLGDMVQGSADQTNSSKVEKYCYNDDLENCEKFGGLYQWSEAMGFPSTCNTNQTNTAGCASAIAVAGTFGVQHQGICPSGWHIMNENDWSRAWDGGSQSTSRLRANLVWSGSNVTGFSALPGGRRKWDGTFDLYQTDAYFWSPEEVSEASSSKQSINYNSTTFSYASHTKINGFSVRCVKNY